jgi:serine/threonine-protein kinase RCK2
MASHKGFAHQFVDLIRHGKHHHQNQPQQQQQQSPPQSAQSAPQQQQQSRVDGRADDRNGVASSSSAQASERTVKQEPQQVPQQVTPESPQPAHREAAEKIVKEEREAKEKMPTYKGLENFKLLEKMGEYVLLGSLRRLSH